MWRYLLARALQSLPGHLLGADPSMLPRLSRFAGHTLCVRLSSDKWGEHSLVLQFQPSGMPVLELRNQPPEHCDLLLIRRAGCLRLEGERRLAARLLAVARHYRPDFEEGLETWLGALPTGAASAVRRQFVAADRRRWAEQLRQALKDIRPLRSAKMRA